MRRKLAVVAVLAVILSSCATLGREFPRCEFPLVDVPISVVMQIQALPQADFGPCLSDLEPGWTYHHMQHETGKVRFWLDSDRLGDRFLTVEMTESCDPGSAAGRPHPNEDIRRFVEATEEIQPIDVVIVPVSDFALDYAAAVGVDLAGFAIRGRPLRPRLDDGSAPAIDRIRAGLDEGAFVVPVDDVDTRQGSIQLRVPGGESAYGASPADAIEIIEDHVEQGSYHATWFHQFDGGCVTFEFDAEGPGVENLVADVERTVHFVDLADLKNQAANAGFILDESELDG